MKRLILVLLLCALLCLAACGKGTDTPATATPGEQTATAAPASQAPSAKPTQTAAATPSATAPSTPEPSPEATPEPTPESTPEPTPEPTPDITPDPTPTPFPGHVQIDTSSPALLRGTADMGQEYIDSITFLGDSTTYGLKAYAVLTDGKKTKQVWTPSNGTLTLSYQGFVDIWYPDDDVEISIRDAVDRKKPERMIITLGVNGIAFMDKDYFISEYTDLVTSIQKISPDTLIILQSIFPIASNYEYQKDINNYKICDANTWILSVAEATGVKFLNTYTVLIGDDGFMNNKYQNGDGLHLNGDGFAVVLDYIRTHGYVKTED
jgi:lysophospholipase L1-like esterase